jgi:IclR family transcriptional regulator, acetate operon repressor
MPGEAKRSDGTAGGARGAADDRYDTRNASDVRSIDRAVAILDSFTARRPALTLSDVAQAVGLGTSTAHRILRSLVAHGLVKRDEAAKTYSLGPHVLKLARNAAGAMDVRELARPILVRLRDAAGETVGLHLLRDERFRVVVDQAESHQPLRRTYTELGEPIPLHQGAPGKVLLAYATEPVRESILEGSLEAANDRTIVDPDQLRHELTRICSDGYSLSFGERVSGIHTVAVPVIDQAGAAVASISVTGPALRMPRQRLESLAPIARAAAAELSTLLGYRGPQEAP